ncbi:MAG: NADH-quinone oxidoreductase subunit M, partial [Dehalococcoidia bacterium]
MLTLFLLLPVTGAMLAMFLPREREHEARWIALLFSGLAFAVSIAIFIRFDSGVEGYQLVNSVEWIRVPGFSVYYRMGVDGLSAPLLLLLGLLSFVSVLISFNIELRIKEYFAWLLLLETAVAGVFMTLDLIQFFLFWELELLPMYMLIS